jgi:mannosyltransferase OCH1-like enzyme/tetratricopeptide (TPR) repeat protein
MGKQRNRRKLRLTKPTAVPKAAPPASNDTDRLIAQALEALEKKDNAQASNLLLAVLNEVPYHPQAHGLLGTLAQQRGDLQRCLAHYTIVAHFFPEREAVQMAVAGLYGRLGQFDQAVKPLEAAALAVAKTGIREPLPNQHQHDLLELGLINLQQGEPRALDAVIDIFSHRNPGLSQAIREARKMPSPTTPDAVLGVCKAIVAFEPDHEFFASDYASWLVAYGRIDEAKEVLNATLEGHPTLWRAWGMLGDLAAADQDPDRAAGYLQKAIDHSPIAEQLYPFLIRNRIQSAAIDEARQAIERATKGAKEPEKILWFEVACLEAMGEPDRALDCAKQLAHQFPDSFDVTMCLAEALIGQGFFEQASALHGKLIQIGTEQQRLAKYLASWYAYQYRFAEAAQVIEQTLLQRSSDTDLMMQLLLFKLFDGNVDQAIVLDQRIDQCLQHRGKEKARFHWRHGFQRALLRAFNTNRAAIDALTRARPLPPSLQVPRLLRDLEHEPGYPGFAVAILVRLRQLGAFNAATSFTPSNIPQQIPKLIHQYWDKAQPPDDVLQLMSSWQANNAGWVCQRLDDATAWDFLDQHCDKQVRQAFETAAHPTLRADLIRLAVLAVQGGVWADADDRAAQGIDHLFPSGVGLLLLQENMGTIGNNFIASAPNHPFIRYALKTVTEHILERQGDSIWFLSGPGALTLAFCHFYKREFRQLTLPAGVHIVDTFTLSRTVAQHLPLAYKHRGAHWNHQKQRNRSLFRNPGGRPRAA